MFLAARSLLNEKQLLIINGLHVFEDSDDTGMICFLRTNGSFYTITIHTFHGITTAVYIIIILFMMRKYSPYGP